MRWLICTVGGSYVPIVKSIQTVRPDRVAFICSRDEAGVKGSYPQVDGEGSVCGKPGEPPSLPNIPSQAGLPDGSWQTVLVSVDNLSDCYTTCLSVIRESQGSDADARITADYTGGSKTMSIGLALAALDSEGVDLKLVIGTRDDLAKVRRDESSHLTRASVHAIVEERVRASVSAMLERFDYSAAAGLLTSYLADVPSESPMHQWLNFCKAFDAWDRFDHSGAYSLLRGFPGCERFLRFLGRVNSALSAVGDDGAPLPVWKAPNGTGFLLAGDILAAAGRKAARCMYDDAVARHYRAVELIAQAYLWKQYEIDTGCCPPERIPEAHRGICGCAGDGGPAQLGLINSWRLAAALDSQLGKMFSGWEGRLLHALERRNYGIMAHGTTPVSCSDYEEDARDGMGAFATAALRLLADRRIAPGDSFPPQFPGQVPNCP